MYNNHRLKKADAELICRFPQSEEELFYMFPRATYPLPPEQLIAAAEERSCPTVVTLEKTIVGYGNFINAELFGRVTDVPWGMVFPGGGPLPRHPSQLYEAFFEGAVLFVLLWLFKDKKVPSGYIVAFFLILAKKS